jgi:membrane fusion protein (multidrug efflux system)
LSDSAPREAAPAPRPASARATGITFERTPAGDGRGGEGAVPIAPFASRSRRIAGHRSVRLVGGAIAIIVIGLLAAHWLHARWTHVFVDDARVAATLVTVSSAVSEIVTAVPISAGDHVAPGDLLVGFDTARIEAELKQVEAERAGLEAQKAQLQAQQEMVRKQLASHSAAAAANLAAAKADAKASAAALVNAEATFDRVRELRQRGVSTVKDFDAAQAADIQAQQQQLHDEASVRTAEANVAAAAAEQVQLTVLDRQIQALEAQLAAKDAEHAQKEVDLSQRRIRAAFAGVIDATFIDPGEFATPGQRLFIYHDPGSVWISANVKETDIRKVSIGAPVSVTVDALPGRSFAGKVIEIGNAATSEFALLPSPNPSGNFTKVTQRLPIKIAVKQVDDLLRPGMMVEAKIDVVH